MLKTRFPLTPFFKDFHKILFGRPPRSASAINEQRVLLGSFALDRLRDIFGRCIPDNVLRIDKKAKGKGVNSRETIFSPSVTFWGFVSQVLSPDSSCRAALTKIQVLCALQKPKKPSPSMRDDPKEAPSTDTSAYSKARHRITLCDLQIILRHSAECLDARATSENLWNGHNAILVDATTASMPDTPENQKRWPQSCNQAEGCGFPIMKLLGLFSLATGAVRDFTESNNNAHENNLLYTLRDRIRTNDLLVGDRIFCSYANICWLKEEKADVLFRKHQSRNSAKCKSEPLGKNDRLVYWKKPHSRAAHSGVTSKIWGTLPDELCVREVTFDVKCKGFRTTKITIVTTLLDPDIYPAEELAQLYLKRWRIELWFDDIKTSMHMDVLRCKTPEMIEKEVLVHLIAYNMIRSVMQVAAAVHGKNLEALSFKGTVDRIQQWVWPIISASNHKQRQSLIDKMLQGIGEDLLPFRPGRYEPRVKKRRPKPYEWAKKSRQEYRDEFAAKRRAALTS
jgi:hypothetical protein